MAEPTVDPWESLNWAEDIDAVAAHIAGLPRSLLLGVDVDGTLAPIVARPEMSALEPMAASALSALVERIGVTVAVVSGRPLADLRHRFGIPDGVLLLGSHGAEVGTEVDQRTTEEQGHINDILERLDAMVTELPGAWIEHKPLAVALHVRQVDDATGEAALDDLRARYDDDADLTLHRGHKVLEFAVRPATKSIAFGQLRRRLAPVTTCFIGDDASDERVFATLSPTDVSIKVGPGETAAVHRLRTPTDVVGMLLALGGMLSTAVR